ncbi:MAG: transposase [Nanoarchaeota archaeon]|nr:transposase [Nanoarchaeota archaeon]
MLSTLELCRQTYNTLLGLLNDQKVIDKSHIQGIIPDMKICNSKFKKLHSKTMQYECYKLFSNLRGLSAVKKKGKKVGSLRFRGKGWFKTFTYNQSGFKIIDNGKRFQTLWLSKIGDIAIRCHRAIKGNIKQITVKKEASGKWYATIIAEQKIIVPKKQIDLNNIVGIDLGLTDVVYDSDNHKITNPRHLNKKAKKLAKLQRQLARTIKRSNNKNKMKLIVARQYEKIVNARNDFLHKISRYYVDKYDAIGFEDMNIANFVKNNIYAKSMLDTCWGRLRQFVVYKAERVGKHYIPVNYKGTTQRCSQCNNIVAKDISVRTHDCPFCGFVASRDYNSALEIKNLMIERIGQELSEYTLVEIPLTAELLQCRSMSYVSVKQ